MIDKIFAFFIFFIFVFIVLFQTLDEIKNFEKKAEFLEKQSSIKIYNLTTCYEILKKPTILTLKINDSFNPSINGIKIITENYICEKEFKTKTKINYSIS